jgi:L-glutamine---4-(methylsulfanyl)-2-oxobutanoate aminotransferase
MCPLAAVPDLNHSNKKPGESAIRLSSRLDNTPLPLIRALTARATELGAINLAGGVPDFPAPAELKAAAVEAILGDYNQYAPTQGVAELRAGIAERLSQRHGVRFDPETEITVVAGAAEGIAAAFLALLEPGDEVLILEPAFTIYAPDVFLSGAVPRYVRLHEPDFLIKRDPLEAAVTPRTRAILLNSPHNPTGRVFSREELAIVAALARRHDLLVVTDEIYDEIVFNGANPPRIWNEAGMRERTVIVNGFSKTYSITGWRLGFVVAPPEISRGIRITHNYLTMSAPAPLQQAAIRAVAFPPSYYDDLRAQYRVRRDLLRSGLERLGIPSREPEGGYFLLADFSSFGWRDDQALAWHLIERTGVAVVPLSGYLSPGNSSSGAFLRFAFCKQEVTLNEALQRLENDSSWRTAPVSGKFCSSG